MIRNKRIIAIIIAIKTTYSYFLFKPFEMNAFWNLVFMVYTVCIKKK